MWLPSRSRLRLRSNLDTIGAPVSGVGFSAALSVLAEPAPERL